MKRETWPRRTGARRILFAACINAASALVSCGGQTVGHAEHRDSGAAHAGTGGVLTESGGAGGGASASGGEGPTLIIDPPGTTGGAGPILWDVAGSGGEGGTVDYCESPVLWDGVTLAAIGGFGTCGPWHCDTDATTGRVRNPWGAVVFDGDGKLVDIVEYVGSWSPPKEDWLVAAKDMRWQCVADQTVEYCCSIPP